MKKMTLSRLRLFLTFLALGCYAAALPGCSDSGSDASGSGDSSAEHDHDHDHEGEHDHEGDHDHEGEGAHSHEGESDDDSHAGHDHPAHGPNGGHMVELSGGAHAEWVHDDQKDEILVYVEKPESVKKVEMTVTIEGDSTSYEFSKVDGEAHYELVSPDLLFSIKMGGNVDTALVVTTEEGALTGPVKHHAH